MASNPTPKIAPPRIGHTSKSEGAFLSTLGGRVRELRARRGMTRKMLSVEADVSERHLAQLESGEGNISVALLRRIAGALSVSIGELFEREAEPSAEEKLLAQVLEQLPPHRVQQALARLRQEFESQEKARRTRIALIGLRGAGKSTLGAMLASHSNLPFIELDREAEKEAGMPLAEIFSLYGQSGYRRIEKRALESVLRQFEDAVISVGGGVVSEKDTFHLLLSNCFTVWIKAQPEQHMARVLAQGDVRAMADNAEAMEDLRRILEARAPLYGKADMQLDTSRDTVDESFAKLRQAVDKNLDRK
jgi:XRE family transcriptional regulator, aerobic/anaerobic benzoate catabolism transcriptional regulator